MGTHEPTSRIPSPAVEARVYPILGFASIRAKAAGAWRVWTVARTLDPAGSGAVSSAALRARLERLGAPERSVRRWMGRARNLGFIEEVWDGDRLLIAAPDRVALAVRGEIRRYALAEGSELAGALQGTDQVGNPAALPAKLLFTNGWRANLWGAFIAGHGSRPMSLETASELTGIPVRTLKRWNRDLRIERSRNYAASQLPGDAVSGLREHGRPAAFEGPDGRAWWRLPDNRRAPRWVRTVPHGRLRKINRKLRSALSHVGQGSETVVRLFYSGHRAAERALARREARSVAEVYTTRGGLSNRAYTVWEPVA